MSIRLTLKLAILERGTTQRFVSVACEIPENRLSAIVRGWIDPRPEERERLETFLGQRDGLFELSKIEHWSHRAAG